MGAKVRMIYLQAKEHQWLWEMSRSQEEARKESSFKSSEEAWPCQHLDFRLLDTRTVKEYISVILSHPICGTLSQRSLGHEYGGECSPVTWACWCLLGHNTLILSDCQDISHFSTSHISNCYVLTMCLLPKNLSMHLSPPSFSHASLLSTNRGHQNPIRETPPCPGGAQWPLRSQTDHVNCHPTSHMCLWPPCFQHISQADCDTLRWFLFFSPFVAFPPLKQILCFIASGEEHARQKATSLKLLGFWFPNPDPIMLGGRSWQRDSGALRSREVQGTSSCWRRDFPEMERRTAGIWPPLFLHLREIAGLRGLWRIWLEGPRLPTTPAPSTAQNGGQRPLPLALVMPPQGMMGIPQQLRWDSPSLVGWALGAKT